VFVFFFGYSRYKARHAFDDDSHAPGLFNAR
jgi:hypothetical protein